MNKLNSRHILALLSLLALGSGSVWAQTAVPGKVSDTSVTKDKKAADEEEVITLSPFVITADEDDGYLATSTLAGSRVRTELKDLAGSTTVITKKFMDDIGAVNNTSLLAYTTNTEVGGLYGNFAGVGNTFIDGSGETATNLLRPQSNTRVRGLDSADNTRDYFATDIPWDGFNIGRVDMQRGPNSILFGIGSPAGIINASVNTAGFKTEGNIQNRIDQFGSMRNSLDYNFVAIPKQLAFRVAAVDDYSKFRQQPAYNRAQRLFAAVRYDPQLFGKDSSARTSIRAYYEYGNVKANRPRGLPPIDRLTPFFDADKINKQYYDSQTAESAGIISYRGTTPGLAKNFWLNGARGLEEWDSPVLIYNNTATPVYAQQGRPRTDGFTYAYPYVGANFGANFPIGIATSNSWASLLDQYGAYTIGGNITRESLGLDNVAAASKGFYKTLQITDPNIFDFYNNLIDGPTKKEWQGWKTFNIALEQSFFNNRLNFQAVYDRQSYYDGNESNLGWNPFLSIDIQKNQLYPEVFTDLSKTNPNLGRVYTSSKPTGGSRSTERENLRFTVSGELRAKDYLGNGLLSRILGRHTITGLLSQEKYDTEDRGWNRFAASNAYSALIYNPARANSVDGQRAPMILENLIYLSPGSVVNYGSASDLHISRILENQAPPDTLAVKYYDSHWKWSSNPLDPEYVNPAEPWQTPVGAPPTEIQTQAHNPANYVGWRDTSISILNADKGDINDLYTSGGKFQTRTFSRGVTWQAFLVEDLIVATAGWRKDTIKTLPGATDKELTRLTGVVSMDYGLDSTALNVKTGENISMGVVAHLPKKLREKLPWDSNISVGVNDSNNNRVQNRYGFSAQALPNAKGHSRDYSLVLHTLNERLKFKVAYYKTTVIDADISSVASSAATLGNNIRELRAVETQSTGAAVKILAGYSGALGRQDEGYWNYAISTPGPFQWQGDMLDPSNPATRQNYLDNPGTIIAKAAADAWVANMLPQSWWDGFGYDVDVAKIKAGDYFTSINHGAWHPGSSPVGGLEGGVPFGGTVNGVPPTGTVDNESHGWEFELSGNPTKNWDISLNASKQYASQTKLGDDLVSFIETQHAKMEGPAGDLRRWWGGDQPMRVTYLQNVWAPYQFQKQTNGKLVGEMAPWRFNMVNNYRFDRGMFKGANVGFAYRWQDKTIWGYELNAARDNLDINQPIWGKTEDYLDLWAGYERQVTDKIKWRVQINVGSVGDKARVIQYNANPTAHITDPSARAALSAGAYRIQEGMTWSITNTFSF